MPETALNTSMPAPHPRSRSLWREVMHKTALWMQALASSPYYRYGEIGNLLYTFGKSILEGAVLYTMFSMAQTEFKVAAILGVLTKYFYPGITFISNVKVSAFVDCLERFADLRLQVRQLIGAMALVGGGQALGAILLLLCYPPLFNTLFGSMAGGRYVLIVLYLLHHICDGSAQVAEGRIWFKLIEIKLRHGRLSRISENFWGIHAMSQNIQLIAGLVLLWGTTLTTGLFQDCLGHAVMWGIVLSGTLLTALSKFSLPLAWQLTLRHRMQEEE
ncbi:hypothetical protein [Syntrophotalea acetylenica]|uniref:hypothetical protein n=1 Tax=Syntrophotalea TaxID=2812025 RepID=UPI002A361514|nr:hypothetical protein [Syntrophotalea acetylenica]MDY0262364.1 hypothetical protein [Syntrophotalea acetylenica]